MTMITLTAEQAQQIEEVLVGAIADSNAMGWITISMEQSLTIIRAARAQEQAEQEPEVWYCPDCGTLSETQVKCCPDWIRSRKVPKNFAFTCKATFDRNVQAEQEPVGFIQYFGNKLCFRESAKNGWYPVFLNAAPQLVKQEPVAERKAQVNELIKESARLIASISDEGDRYLTAIDTLRNAYRLGLKDAAPVRAKDLTDDEIDEIFAEYGSIQNTKAVRAVIAADREKNRA